MNEMNPRFSRWGCFSCGSSMLYHESNKYRFINENNEEITVDVSCSICPDCHAEFFGMEDTKKILDAFEFGKSKNDSIDENSYIPDLKEIQKLTEKTKNSMDYKKLQKLKESFAIAIREAALKGEWETSVSLDNHASLNLLEKALNEYKEAGFGFVKELDKNRNLSAITFYWEKGV